MLKHVVRWKLGAITCLVWVLWVAAPVGPGWSADSKTRVEIFAAGFEMEANPTAGFYGIAGATYGATARVFAQASYGVWQAGEKELRFGVDYSWACICLFICPYFAFCEPSPGIDLGFEIGNSGFHLRYPFGANQIPAGIFGYTRRF